MPHDVRRLTFPRALLHRLLPWLLFGVVSLCDQGYSQPAVHIPVKPPVVHDAVVSFPADLSSCPDCSPEDIRILGEVNTKYQGMKGNNPSAPSSYNLIGKHKFSGSGWNFTNSFFGENWYTIRTEKQILTGTFHDFGVANYGDESDWNIHILPDPGFEDLIADAIPYQRDNWYASGDWPTTEDGRFLIEAEITPDEHRYGNPWFTNTTEKSILVGKKLSAYGPFVREEAHGNHPEIHPSEQIWWREADGALMVLLLADDSNRFKRRADTIRIVNGRPTLLPGDFSARRVTSFAYVPWAQEKGQEAELNLAFEFDPAKGGEYMSIQAVDALNFYSAASYPDVDAGDKNTITYKGNAVLTVQEAADIDPFVGVTFSNVCFNRSRGTLQGYVVLKTAIGNGDGKEGFVALRIDTRSVGVNAKPTLLVGDLLNTWKPHSLYDGQVSFADIISSDMHGKGIVCGRMDFNGNGKTDLFAKKGDRWLVLYDGKGTWQEINTSSIPKEQLRFGDVDGDGKTDILRVSPRRKVEVSYGGTGQWTEVTDAGDQNPNIQVGDFNGDGKTDIVYLKFVPTGSIAMGYLYVKFGCKGSWKLLNKTLKITASNAAEYATNVRFGNFNGDRITDIFRYTNKRFGVYYNGTGDFKELCNPGINLRMDDLLFVTDLTSINYTDVIYVDPNTKKWTVFYRGKPGSLPLTIKYGDPSLVRFGDLDPDPVVEPIAMDFAEQRVSPLDIPMATVSKARIEPAIMPRYVPGSLKRVESGEKASLTVSLDLKYFPGTIDATRKKSDFRAVSGARERVGGRSLRFTPAPAGDAVSDEPGTIGILEGVSVAGEQGNAVDVAFVSRPAPESYKLPAYAITGIPDRVVMHQGTGASWKNWKDFLSDSVGSSRVNLLDSPPASPTAVKSIAFELLPFYSVIDDGRVSVVEADDVTKDLNQIAYGRDGTRVSELFGGRKVFAIQWTFELKDLSTGKLLTIPNAGALVADGKWAKNKVAFAFPQNSTLLQFKAAATITDGLGNKSNAPIEVVFWNQRIVMNAPESQVENWLAPVRGDMGTAYRTLLTKGRYMAEDSVLTPAELRSLVR
jgi:hypothetical protein